MKTSIFLLSSIWICLFFPACDGETTINFPSDIIQDSRISDSTFQILLDDSKLLCLNLYLNEESKELNNIEIEESHIAPIISAIQMVFLDSLLPASSQIRDYGIHTLCPIQLHEGILQSDSLNPHIISWIQNSYSDYNILDDYIYTYNISLDSLGNNQFLYHSEIGINQLALATEFEEIDFITSANSSFCAGDGSQIEIIDLENDFIHLIYSYGWDDCPSGCINRHYWEIGVYGSGIVELISESGNQLP
jgi:hypothetical protein